jgi:hypothetical protein
MKKMLLNLEALKVETFEVADTLASRRGTVNGAEAALATLVLSGCGSCMNSGPRPCFATETCC